MAERRMFAKTIVDSDAFLEMPISARLLYYDLAMRADDDGFINSPKKIMKFIGATNDDMNILIMRKFIIPFDNGIVVIKHWRIHNYIRKDTYNETSYKEQKAMLELDENKAYRLSQGNSVDDSLTQVSIGKVSIVEDSIGKDSKLESKDSNCQTEVRRVIDEWNSLSVYGIKQISKIDNQSKRYGNLNARLKQYGIENVLKAIDNIRNSDFLQGKHKGNPWQITFDWFVLPNNFPKVLEGNYNNEVSVVENTSVAEKWMNGGN